MRQVVLDTETTGLEPKEHRIIEIGCVELVNRRLTGNNYHVYLNPEREVEFGAEQVHGLSNEFLSNKQKFAEIADEFLAYLGEAELIIHNAPFDLGFLNMELARWQRDHWVLEERLSVIDTLVEARRMHPGQRNSLDALCKRYEIDNSARDLHGALLDAELLADLYLALTGGQTDMQLDVSSSQVSEQGESVAALLERLGQRPKVIALSEDEQRAHQASLQAIDKNSDGQCLWLSTTSSSEA